MHLTERDRARNGRAANRALELERLEPRVLLDADFGPPQVITTAAAGAYSVCACDLDGDGDADVLSASHLDDKIAWYENLGGGSFGAQQVITTAADGAWSVYACDLDGDGDADVLSASDHDDKIAWYENLSGGSFGAQQVITTAAYGAISVYACDVDGDGDADVLSASLGRPLLTQDSKIAWYENLSGGSFGAQQVITTAADWAVSVYACDLDGDGDADVLSASGLDDKIAWYENLGGGSFGAQQVITTAAAGGGSVRACDLDGDGDADVLSASHWDDKIAWYENLGGGSFGAQQAMTTAADGAWSVYACDLDGDGDADVLSASFDDDKIAWYENLGGGSFGAQQAITTAADRAVSVYACDLDGDGDADVLSASFDDDKIAWYENLGGGANQPPTIGSVTDAPDPVIKGDDLTLTASGVNDVDGTVGVVEFYRDENGNGTLETGTDLLLGTDTNGADGWQTTADTTGWASGMYTYLARAQDNDLLWSYATAATGEVNERPTIAALTDSPDPILPGDVLTLAATGVADADGTVALVEFWRDENHSGALEPDQDLPLGTDSSAAGGWQVVVDTTAWQSGNYTYLARAQDDDGAWSQDADANGRVDFILIDAANVGGALVSIYDMDASNGISDPDIAWSSAQYVPGVTDVLVLPGAGSTVQAIILYGDGSETEDLAFVVDNNAALDSVVDLRTATTPFGFVLSEGPVNYLSLKGTVRGGDVNRFVTAGGWALSSDVDGDGLTYDPTAVYSGGNAGALIFQGDVNGDIVVDGNLPFLQVLGGDLNGDVVLLSSDIGTVLAQAKNVGAGWSGGDITGDVMATGSIGAVLAIGGGISGNIEAPTGSVGAVMAINGAITSPTIYGQTGVNLVQAINGGVSSSITSGAGLGTVMALNGDLDVSGGRSISAGGTVKALMAINGDILGDGIASPDICVGNGNLWTLQAVGGGMQSVWVDVNGAGASSGRLGSVYVGGSMTESRFEADGLLSSVYVGGSVSNSLFETDGLLSSLFSQNDFYNSTVQSGSLSVVYVRGRISENSTDGDTDEIHADTGSYYVIDSHKFSQITPTAFDVFGGVIASAS